MNLGMFHDFSTITAHEQPKFARDQAHLRNRIEDDFEDLLDNGADYNSVIEFVERHYDKNLREGALNLLESASRIVGLSLPAAVQAVAKSQNARAAQYRPGASFI